MLLNKLIVSLIIPISVVLISGCVDSTNKIQAIEATSLSGTALDLKDSTTYDNTPPVLNEAEFSFANYKMEFETGMSVGTEYSVNAYLDPSGLYICDFNNEGLRLGQSCAGTGLGVVYVHNSFDKEKSKELYQLRGKAVCLTTVSAGGQNWIKRFSIGKCNK